MSHGSVLWGNMCLLSGFVQGGMPADFRGALTVDNFVAGRLNVPGLAGDSQLSLRGKAATLFERATYLSSQWSPSKPLLS